MLMFTKQHHAYVAPDASAGRGCFTSSAGSVYCPAHASAYFSARRVEESAVNPTRFEVRTSGRCKVGTELKLKSSDDCRTVASALKLMGDVSFKAPFCNIGGVFYSSTLQCSSKYRCLCGSELPNKQYAVLRTICYRLTVPSRHT